MSSELFKSMTYKDGKVFTRQCSNNVYPKDYYSEENTGLTKIYNKLGKVDFEKWFITNGLMQGNIVILGGSNKILKRLNYIENLLWDDSKFNKLRNDKDKSYMKSLSAITEEEKKIAHNECTKIEEDIAKYISSFYDEHNPKYKEKERER